MWRRLLSMYTILNVCAVLTISWMPEPIKDIIRASTLLIVVVMFTIWTSGKTRIIYEELFDSFAPNNDIHPDIKFRTTLVADFLLHVVPLLVIGLPLLSESMFIAYMILLMWYVPVRGDIHAIYSKSVPADKGILYAGIVTAGSMFVLKM